LPIFVTFFYLVQIKFGTEGTHKYSLSDCECYWNRYSENHTWSADVHKLLHTLSTFIFWFGWHLV